MGDPCSHDQRRSAELPVGHDSGYTRNRNLVERPTSELPVGDGYPNRIRQGDRSASSTGYTPFVTVRRVRISSTPSDAFGRARVCRDVAQRRAIAGGNCADSANRVLGDPNPDWVGSLLNEFQVGKALRMRVLLDGSFGNDVMNLSRRIRDLGTALNSPENEAEFLPYGDPRKLPPGFFARRLGIFSEYVEDGSFVKLREVSATYTFTNPVVTRYLSDGIELTLSGRNLYTWSEYSGYDPEGNLFGQNAPGLTTTAADRGFDFAGVPIPRTWSASLRFTY